MPTTCSLGLESISQGTSVSPGPWTSTTNGFADSRRTFDDFLFDFGGVSLSVVK